MPRYESPYDPSAMPRNLEHVKYEKKGHVAYVTINRPDVLNALHTYAYAELRACWRDIGLDPNIYVGIVTGAGKAFCAGRDVKFLAEHQAKGIRTPHEDPNNPLFFWGGGGQPSRRQPREAADRGDQRPRGRRGPHARAAVPASHHGRHRVDRRHAHQDRPAGLVPQPVRRAAAHDRRVSHAVQRTPHRAGVLRAGDREQGRARATS